jgi:hypothetical protein
MNGMSWFEIRPPDNPMSINIAQIVYIAKLGDGCKIRTADGTDHVFHAVSYEAMMNRFGVEVHP